MRSAPRSCSSELLSPDPPPHTQAAGPHPEPACSLQRARTLPRADSLGPHSVCLPEQGPATEPPGAGQPGTTQPAPAHRGVWAPAGDIFSQGWGPPGLLLGQALLRATQDSRQRCRGPNRSFSQPAPTAPARGSRAGAPGGWRPGPKQRSAGPAPPLRTCRGFSVFTWTQQLSSFGSFSLPLSRNIEVTLLMPGQLRRHWVQLPGSQHRPHLLGQKYLLPQWP